MGKQLSIADIVRKSDVVVNAQESISAIYRLMKAHQLKHIPVADQRKIVGIISGQTIRRLGFGYVYEERQDVELGMLDMLQANQVMDAAPPLVSLDASVAEVAELMVHNELVALPVIHKENLVGIIDINDILLFLLAEH